MLFDRIRRSAAHRELLAARRTAIGELVEGRPAVIAGRILARGDEVLVAPLTTRPCVVYRIDATLSPTAAIHERSTGAWLVRDASGSAIVDLEHAVLLLSRRTRRTPFARIRYERERTVAARHGRDHLRSWRERIVLPGDTVVVRGLPVREVRPDAARAERGYRDDLATRFGSSAATICRSSSPTPSAATDPISISSRHERGGARSPSGSTLWCGAWKRS